MMKTDPDPRALSTPTEAPSRSLVRAAVLEQLRRFKQARGAEFRVSRLGVFGSVARDEAGAESDVDVVFETDDPNLFRTAHLRQELEEWLGCPVDIVRLRPTMNASLRERILREARYV
ncbi:nucleotidyltransferase family protein [Thioalkalivibrio paradoxus]|uniref:nucleotidyltransferase family protein n=1 Tax=Thioalkalivibrio paradoxus TaxID=108010 RepID=UPI00022C2C15|nr:nucleotidyltransferase domain-containing protein [Thioalkalivibrio paradoxus]